MPLLDKYPAPLTAKAAEHLLRRTMFGASRADIATLTGKTIDQALDMLLKDQPAPAAPIDPTTGKTWVNDTSRSQNEGQLMNYMKAWWIGLMVNQPISITEKMTLFWHNHFASSFSVVNDSRFLYKQHQTLRKNVLGNVKTFVVEITQDPAMLVYLNGNRNTRVSPQENYAREVQELFTIGKGPEIAPGNYTTYTEDDVKAAARVLTGWHMENPMLPVSKFEPTRHDDKPKQFSSAYQNTVITGRSDKDAGLAELNDFLNMIFKQNATSEYLVTKLYRYFVNFKITDAVQKEVITPLGKIFRDNNFEVKPVLRALLGSVHFFDNNIIGCMIKAPLDLLVGTLRQLQIEVPAQNQAALYYAFFNQIQSLSGALQQNLFELPNVAGWQAYYQEPAFYQIWINSATMPSRTNFSNTILKGWTVSDSVSNTSKPILFDTVAFLQKFPDPRIFAVPANVVDAFVQNFYAIDLTEEQLEYLTATIFLGGSNATVWTDEWNNFLKTPFDDTKKNAIKPELDKLLLHMMRLAEYQIT